MHNRTNYCVFHQGVFFRIGQPYQEPACLPAHIKVKAKSAAVVQPEAATKAVADEATSSNNSNSSNTQAETVDALQLMRSLLPYGDTPPSASSGSGQPKTRSRLPAADQQHAGTQPGSSQRSSQRSSPIASSLAGSSLAETTSSCSAASTASGLSCGLNADTVSMDLTKAAVLCLSLRDSFLRRAKACLLGAGSMHVPHTFRAVLCTGYCFFHVPVCATRLAAQELKQTRQQTRHQAPPLAVASTGCGHAWLQQTSMQEHSLAAASAAPSRAAWQAAASTAASAAASAAAPLPAAWQAASWLRPPAPAGAPAQQQACPAARTRTR
jgi:hypothetical protein